MFGHTLMYIAFKASIHLKHSRCMQGHRGHGHSVEQQQRHPAQCFMDIMDIREIGDIGD